MHTKHTFYVTFNELGGKENIAPFPTVLRRAAKAAGMRVHTFRGTHEPILWILDPDYTPSPERMREVVEAAALTHLDEPPAPAHGHLRIV